MYRLMIVDDDAIIRRGLSRNVAWAEHGFELVGTAGDGEQGLELFAQFQPEIVISDIKMPFLDGMGLARRLLSIAPQTKLILLTGYGEFEYAKQALELKIFDYILKPVDLEVLLQTVQRAAAGLDEENKIRWQINESRPLLQQRFLTRLVEGKYSAEEEALAEAEFLEMNLGQETFAVIVVKIDEYHNASLFSGVAAQETAKFQIVNLCRDIAAETVAVLNPGGDTLVLIWGGQGEAAETTAEGLRLGERVWEEVNRQFSISVTLGIGNAYPGLLGIAASFREARAATEFRHIFGKNQVLAIADTGMPLGGELLDFKEYKEELGLKVKLGLNNEARAILSEIEQRLLQGHFIPLSSVQLVGMQMAISALQEAQLGENDPVGQNRFFFERLHPIQEGQTVQEIFGALRDLVTEITTAINRQREVLQESVIGQAMQFIEANYCREGLSLTDVAKVVHVSPVYLSIMFKKEKNINFSDYLTELRMKLAMELLRNSDLKTYEVAERVGYSNPQYFSVCFKKYSGASPSDFKKQ